MRRIVEQSFKLLPELYPDLPGQVIEPFEDGIGDNYISRQSVSAPLSHS